MLQKRLTIVNLNDIDVAYDFDIIKELFCKANNVNNIGSCDGIVFLNSNKIILIEFKLGCKSAKMLKEKSTQLRDKLFSSLDIICNICNIDIRLKFSQNNIVYYIVYNEDIFYVDKSLKDFSSGYDYEFDYENAFFGSLTQKANLLCKYLSLDYFKKFLVNDVRVVTKGELEKDKINWEVI